MYTRHQCFDRIRDSAVRREIMRPRRRDGERDGHRESSRCVGQVGAAGVTYGRRPWKARRRRDRCREFRLYAPPHREDPRKLTSAVFPERYAAVLLREVRWLERVLVLEFPMRRLAAAQRHAARRHEKNKKPPHLGGHLHLD